MAGYQNCTKASFCLWRLENLHANQMFLTSAEAKGEDWDPVKLVQAPSNLLLTVLRRYICFGSSMLHVVMSVCIWSSELRSAARYASYFVLFCNLK